MSVVSIPARPSTPPPTGGFAGAFMRRLRRTGLVGLGYFLIVASPFVGIIPGPGGIPVFLLGLVLVLKNSRGARRLFVKTERNHPKWIKPIRAMMQQRDDAFAQTWRMLLRIERMVLPRSLRPFSLRKRFKRKPAAAAAA